MSWASLLRESKKENPTSQGTGVDSDEKSQSIVQSLRPPTVVLSTANSSLQSGVENLITRISDSNFTVDALQSGNDTRIHPIDADTGPVASRIVLDTGAFLRVPNWSELADEIYTVPEVLREIRDARHRQALQNALCEIKVHSPGPNAVSTVIAHTKQSGDFSSLSRTDLKVMALTYQLAKEAGVLQEKDSHSADGTESELEKSEVGQNRSKECCSDENSETEIESQTNSASEEWAEYEENEKEDDDWITSENLQERIAQDSSGIKQLSCEDNSRIYVPTAEDIHTADVPTVSCLTIDFSMQNALMHLGVPVIGTDGRIIKRIRTWVLRCHACYTIVHDSDRQFCPSCGSGNTLKKVSYSIDKDTGEHKMWINWSRRINTRGIRYSIPKPRWGAHGTNKTLALREDQLRDFGKPKSLRNKQHLRELMREQDPDRGSYLGADYKKKAGHRLRENSSYSRFNINERRNLRAAHRK